MNTRSSLFKQCSNKIPDKQELWYLIKQLLLYPTCWIGGMSQNVGLTGFGLLKFFHFCFGNNRDLEDPEVLATAVYFMACTAYVIYRTRMPGLRENILSEQYNIDPKTRKNIPYVFKKLWTYLKKCGNNNESKRERLGEGIELLLQLSCIVSGGLNFFNMLLNTSTLYNYGYKMIYHSDEPTDMTGEEIYSVITAITANLVYFTFNISGALEGCEKLGQWIKGKVPLYKDNDEKWIFIKFFILMSLQAGCSPFFAYLSSHNALKQLPFGMHDRISESFNDNFSMISSALFVITSCCTRGSGMYNFWKDRALSTERSLNKKSLPPCDKFLTYFFGFGDSIGNAIGSFVAYCFLMNDFFGTSKHDKHNPFTFNHFINEFSNWPWHMVAAFLVAFLSGSINWMFSIKNGSERAVEVEGRLKNEYKSSALDRFSNRCKTSFLDLLKDKCSPLLFCCPQNRRFIGNSTIQDDKTDFHDPVVSSHTNDLKEPFLAKMNGHMNGNGFNHSDENDATDEPLGNYCPPSVPGSETVETLVDVHPASVPNGKPKEALGGFFPPPDVQPLGSGHLPRSRLG